MSAARRVSAIIAAWAEVEAASAKSVGRLRGVHMAGDPYLHVIRRWSASAGDAASDLVFLPTRTPTRSRNIWIW